MNSNKKPLFKIGYSGRIIFIISLMLISLFIIIYIITAFITRRADFHSFFFNNIKENIFLMIASAVHVSLLAIGILLFLLSIIYSREKILCFDDRFEIYRNMNKKIIVPYNDITNITLSVLMISFKKEFRATFYCKDFSFFVTSDYKGYCDEIKIIQPGLEDMLGIKNKISIEQIKEVVKLIKNNNNNQTIKNIFFPDIKSF